MKTMEEEKAKIIINLIRTELKLGTKHYNRKGKLLKTEKEILKTLIKEGGITIEPTGERIGVFNTN